MSSLDSETEDKIIENIITEFADSTVIIVSHRLSTAKKMDLIYFLQDSTHMDKGSHDELLIRNPRYKELFASQIEAKNYPSGLKPF
jgi:ATP-binding cassette subfamily B multidrug efflux pump